MNVLVVNCGSSSLKFQLINSETEAVAAKGLCERIGIDGRLVYQPTGGEKETTEAPMPTHTEAIKMVLDALVNPKTGVLKSLDEVEALSLIHICIHTNQFHVRFCQVLCKFCLCPHCCCLNTTNHKYYCVFIICHFHHPFCDSFHPESCDTFIFNCFREFCVKMCIIYRSESDHNRRVQWLPI